MPEIVQNCPLCGSSRRKLFDQRDFRGKRVTNQLCLECGLVYQSPRMNEAESAEFYTSEYRLLYEVNEDATSRNLVNQHDRAVSLLAFSKPWIGSVTRHLDIGCSFGLLLERFQENYHCQSFGIEPGEAHRERARKSGLSVFTSLEELEIIESGPFDLISMAHVLEHLPDPVAYLFRLREVFLISDGFLLLEVPNLYAHDSFEIAHLISYCSHTLSQVLNKAGYRIIALEKHGRPRSKFLPLYITVMAQSISEKPLSWHVSPERSVFLKRQIGMFKRKLLERFFPNQAWIS
jgi:2-polyprenyl-3-methyl-5-hydroxy-6-metoxy-1,4-benzoquinol methylase